VTICRRIAREKVTASVVRKGEGRSPASTRIDYWKRWPSARSARMLGAGSTSLTVAGARAQPAVRRSDYNVGGKCALRRHFFFSIATIVSTSLETMLFSIFAFGRRSISASKIRSLTVRQQTIWSWWLVISQFETAWPPSKLVGANCTRRRSNCVNTR